MLEVQIALKRGNFELQLGFCLAECGIAVIFGPSGSGKTSLINCIAGLETPDTGRIVCHGETRFTGCGRKELTGYGMVCACRATRAQCWRDAQALSRGNAA